MMAAVKLSSRKRRQGEDHAFRVLMVTHFYPPHMGGIERVAAEEVARLGCTGVRVRVLTTTTGVGNGQDEPGVHRVRAVVPLHRSGVPFPITSPSLLWRSARLVHASDLVHVHDSLYVTSWVTALMCRLMRRPFV